ncbi:MAG: MFS transporter [Chlamydiia bacterium]|nr:MFS transporter [Chlamydiia bacterium]
MTYEGARSIIGPYLSLLGASGAVVGLIVGLGEFIGYGMRLLSGYATDRFRHYWGITFLGYAINLCAVPLLAWADHWQTAAALIVLERFGKAIRVPSRDAMLSYATHQTGRGWGFGLHEALDQIGAVIGPLFIMLSLFWGESYRWGFAFLAFPAAASLITLTLARLSFPCPQSMEISVQKWEGLSRNYWIYVVAVGLVSCGFANFALISFHFQKASAVAPMWIAGLYALAMAIAGGSALIMGRWFDRQGLSVLAWTTGLSSLFAPLVFWGEGYAIGLGMILWGIGVGSQESIMRAAVAHFSSSEKRGRAYGILNFAIGLGWGIGSFAIGALYDLGIAYAVAFSLLVQWAAIPLLLSLKK